MDTTKFTIISTATIFLYMTEKNEHLKKKPLISFDARKQAMPELSIHLFFFFLPFFLFFWTPAVLTHVQLSDFDTRNVAVKTTNGCKNRTFAVRITRKTSKKNITNRRKKQLRTKITSRPIELSHAILDSRPFHQRKKELHRAICTLYT